MELKVKIKKLREDAILPTYAKPGDAGMDLTAAEMRYDTEKDCFIYHTGLAVELPKGYAMFLYPRSSNFKTECYMTNHVGIIDSGYRGEILITYKDRTCQKFVKAFNTLLATVNTALQRLGLVKHSNKFFVMDCPPYEVGDRIAQAVIMPYPEVIFEETDELSESERGAGGHGSTGK